MAWNARKGVMVFAAAMSIAVAGPSVASTAPQAEAFDAKIAQAQSVMMADSSAALRLAREAKALSKGESLDSRKDRLTAQWLEGEALVRLNRGDEARAIIKDALKETAREFPKDKLYADLLRSHGSFQARSGEYGAALSTFLKAHDLYQALGEPRSQAIVLQNIGSLYSDARDYERVLRYYRQATEAFPEDNALSLSAHNNKGNALKELKRLEEAEEEFRLALGVAGKMDSPTLEARILTNIASTQFLNGQYVAAEDTVARGLRIAHSEAPEWLPFLYGVRAQIELARGNLARAENYITRTFAGQDLTNTPSHFRDFHQTAYKIYDGRGKYRDSAQHLAAFYRIESQARDLSATANNALLGARFDAENRELRISKLSAEKQANEVSLASAQNKVFLLSGLIALVIGAFVVALLTLRTVNRSKAAISAANDKLTYVSQHDGLTGLFSREHFRDSLEEAAKEVEGTGKQAALMFIDLDRFKQVNDVYGHAAGDELLAQVADRFRHAAGPDALIGRLGGDEFALYLPPSVTAGQAGDIASRIIEAVSQPYRIGDYDMFVGASIGIAMVDAETSASSVLMTNADLALYDAKHNGRGTFAHYQSGMRTRLEERSNLETDLAAALENGQLSIYYQPIVCGTSREIICYEALMRWKHPERGIVPPDVFIPIAEEALLIEQLGAWMLRSACAEAASWDNDIKLSANVSTLQLSTGAFQATVVEALASSGLRPDRLLLELTESMVLEMDDQLESLLASLNELGVQFALDDFGRGYSSLNYIEKMEFSMIKIDRDFVQSAAAGSRQSKAIVSAIVSLAQSLNILVTAEGIENEEQVVAMDELGCTCFQGYHFGRPKPFRADQALEVEEPDRKVA